MNKTEKFGEFVLKLLDERGWHSIPRRELTIRLLDAAMRAGIFAPPYSRYDLAMKLRVSPTIVDGMLRDKALFCEDLTPMQMNELEDWATYSNQTTSQDIERGQFVFAAQNALEQMQVEALLEKLGIAADYKNNKRLLAIEVKTLVKRIASSNDMQDRLLSKLVTDKRQRAEISLQLNANPHQRLLKLALDAGKEQIGKRVGEKTTEFFLAACNAIWSTAGRSRNESQ